MSADGRQLSYLLRHGAVKEGLSLNSEGFIEVRILLNHLRKSRSRITSFSNLKHIVDADNKSRFLLKTINGKQYIRANQGHTIRTVTEDALTPITDHTQYPEVIHGTFRQHLDAIRRTGLSRMQRNHIHFASSMDASSGVRKTGDVFIYVNLERALREGIKFYVSDNGVILTPGNAEGYLEPKYFSKIVDPQAVSNNHVVPNTALNNIPCGGCLVFRTNPHQQLEVCLISTQNGIYGFPKGKREKGEDLVKCALRELHEETGITEADITPIDVNKYVDEVSQSGKSIAIRLYVVRIIKKVTLNPQDTEEISKCEFVSIDLAQSLLMEKRQNVLNTALRLL